ncbi:site-specific recombinase XerC [Labedella gwakjiensis]|uniref:Site-specific integrase n=1 Tax=Labedella gwakjiensis TaxID=390269 RepID=A0A2P8H0A7_9MICO|nr:site-specific integrase [Labedella gwakjiensis]PSL39632.1 site-specific recombinase XerC [Labedella gwakjiensis]RUQ85979.1 site-specific integrase [Labedella gwakjiensis]
MSRIAKGSIRLEKSGRWSVRYINTVGKRVSGGTFTTKTDAARHLRTVLVDIERGEHVEKEKSRVLFSAVVDKVMVIRQTEVAPGTYRNDLSALRAVILPTFGSKRIGDIDEEEVDLWWAANAHRKASRQAAYQLLRKIMKKAVSWKYIRISPCNVEKKRGEQAHTTRPVFTVNQFLDVLEHTPLELQVVLWVTFSAHLRLGEVLGLNRGDFDKKTGVLTVQRQLTNIGSKSLRQTKTGRVKKLTLLPEGLEELRAYVDARNIFDLAPMFVGKKGDRLSHNALRSAFIKAREAAGVPTMHFHDIRHISLTHVAQNGATLKDVMHRGDHTTERMALVYQGTDAARDAQVAARAGIRRRA